MPPLPLGLTFDDVLLIPQESDVKLSEVDLRTRLTKGLMLDVPLMSAAMDTVTEAAMAIALAQAGGIGILHRNCAVELQVAMVKQVKARQMRVGAAVGPHDQERALVLDRAGCDVICVDSAHAHKPGTVAELRQMRKKVKAQLIVGNIATAAAAKALAPYADALKVGVGPGSICTTRVVAGVGVPQLTAIMVVAAAAKHDKLPVIADGGIRYPGDIAKAIAAGAESVMLGSLLAGTDEAPGEVAEINGRKWKRYRGMGSLGAMEVGQSTDRYFQKGSEKYVPEGVEALKPYQGPVNEIIYQLLGGLRSGMGYMGAHSIAELRKRGRFIRITEAGRAESHPHSVTIEREAPNYRIKN